MGQPAVTEHPMPVSHHLLPSQGAFAGPVFGGIPSERIFCNDTLSASEVRYMESFEARHSNHGLAGQIGGAVLPAARGWCACVGWAAEPCRAALTCTGLLIHTPACSLPTPFPFVDSSAHLPTIPVAEIGIELPSLRLDSQAKYGALSRGDASIFMRFPDPSYREKIWDHAAGVIIIQVGGRMLVVLAEVGRVGHQSIACSCATYLLHAIVCPPACLAWLCLLPCLQESGAVISDALGNPLDFTLGRHFPFLNGGIVAATPSMHAAIMAALRKIRAAGADTGAVQQH
jgi:hypothetical protein